MDAWGALNASIVFSILVLANGLEQTNTSDISNSSYASEVSNSSYTEDIDSSLDASRLIHIEILWGISALIVFCVSTLSVLTLCVTIVCVSSRQSNIQLSGSRVGWRDSPYRCFIPQIIAHMGGGCWPCCRNAEEHWTVLKPTTLIQNKDSKCRTLDAASILDTM